MRVEANKHARLHALRQEFLTLRFAAIAENHVVGLAEFDTFPQPGARVCVGDQRRGGAMVLPQGG